MILGFYKMLSTLGGPLIERHLESRLKKGKEDPARFPERKGQSQAPRPKGPLVWLHGASVGEANSLLSLIDAIQATYPGLRLLMTTGTVTSAQLMSKRLPEGVIHQFIPVDRPAYVMAFLDHWRPDFAIWSESDLWPNMLQEAHARQIPMVLVNARMSQKSLKKWRMFPRSIKTLLNCFELCLAQTKTDGQRFKDLGCANVESLGNLKFAAAPLPYEPEKLEILQDKTSGRKLWLAASTHGGDEETCAQIHKMLRNIFPDLLTVIAPRHPDRADEILQELSPLCLKIARRSKGEELDRDTDIYLADTIGEMGVFYRLCPIVFMGKSLKPLGGQNPLEPARLNCAIITGAHMSNFVEIMARFEAVNAITVVPDAAQLKDTLQNLLSSESQCKTLASKAKVVAEAEAAVLDRVMTALGPFLDRLKRPS